MPEYRTKAQLVVAIDDTDNPEQGGTGRVAREIAQRLAARFPIWGVSRHQFAVLPGIPYTRNNSGNAIHVLAEVPSPEALAEEVGEWLRELCLPGSDPGLCVAHPAALAGNDFGPAAQTRVLTRDEARAVAAAAGVILTHPCATDDGLIGALAGACLASGGNDGRFVEVGEMRSLSSTLTVADVIGAGGDEVRAVEGGALTDAVIVAERLRPALRGGRCVLYCRRGADGVWTPIVGAPVTGAERAEPMSETTAVIPRGRAEAQTLVQDLAALLGFSVALAITAGVIKTPMQLPGHSALLWLPVLVLAGAHRRTGMVIGTAVCGGALALSFRGTDALGLASLLAAASAIEAFSVNREGRSRGLRMILAGLCAHVGKLLVKLVAAAATGLPLNEALLPILPTLALYLAFGVSAGIVAWGVFAAYHRLRPSHAPPA